MGGGVSALGERGGRAGRAQQQHQRRWWVGFCVCLPVCRRPPMQQLSVTRKHGGNLDGPARSLVHAATRRRQQSYLVGWIGKGRVEAGTRALVQGPGGGGLRLLALFLLVTFCSWLTPAPPRPPSTRVPAKDRRNKTSEAPRSSLANSV